jgi:signal transduction histidine kinase
MIDQIELASVGLAAVIDTVLLLAIFEPRNRQHLTVPIFAMVVGAWMLHAGAFARLLLFDLTGPLALQIHWLALAVMNCGVLLVPSAMAHGCLRLWNTGLRPQPESRAWYAAAYLPLVVMLPISLHVAADPRGNYIELTTPLRLPYAIWLTAVNFGSIACCLRARRQIAYDRARQFFAILAAVQGLSGAVQAAILFYAIPTWTTWQRPFELIVLLTPTILAALFGYFVVRFNFMQLMLERTVVYAAILLTIMLFHHVAVQDLQAKLEDRFRVDFGILEAILVAGLIVAYQPLRQRAAESLRYLLGSRVAQVRQQTQGLSMQLSSLAGREPRELLQWFCQAIEQVVAGKYVAAWLFDASDRPLEMCGGRGPSDAQAIEMFRSMKQSNENAWTARAPAAHSQLLQVEAELAVRFEQPAAAGLLVFGRRGGNREYPAEEVGAIVLLVEQLGIMLHNSWLQSERLHAQRRAMQNEKLSTLGLLASSIAHEIKNPLSSIKTIAAVLAEDLGPDHARAEDLRLILGEVDRLANTTSQLLSFVRPASANGQPYSVLTILESILSVMRHWARERGVQLECCLGENAGTVSNDTVAADEASLREVFFNLLQNAIEAAGRGGRVTISCRSVTPTEGASSVVVEVHDSGPGIAPEVQDRLFEPFVTTKASGTGLGLYLVGQRIRDIGGEVRCRSSPQQGTLFTVTIPSAMNHGSDTR